LSVNISNFKFIIIFLCNVSVFYVFFRALSSFDGLDFGAVKQNLDSAHLTVANIDVADIDTSTELLVGRSCLSTRDALELAHHKLLRAITALHVEDDSDHARLVLHTNLIVVSLMLCRAHTFEGFRGRSG